MTQPSTPRTDGLRRNLKERGERDHVIAAAMTNLARQLERELTIVLREAAIKKAQNP